MKTLKKVVLAVVMMVGMLSALGGCSATPMGAAIGLAGLAVNDADINGKSKELMGASVAQCDQSLGQPLEIYQSQQPPREWRVYPVKYDLTSNYRYIAEFSDGKVIALSKAQFSSDIIVDAATLASFTSKCKGKSAQACQDSIGCPPALTVHNVRTGQLVQLYDARTVKDLQKPYYGVLRFGKDGLCSEIKVANVPASTEKDPTAANGR